MSIRKAFIEYVKEGGDRPLVSFQIGAGAGFDAKLAEREWISESILQDTIHAYEQVGGWPLFNVGLPDLGGPIPKLRWQSHVETCRGLRITRSWLDTPWGPLKREFREQPRMGICPVRYPLIFGDNLDVVNWYAEQFVQGIPYVGELLRDTLDRLQTIGPVSVQWNLQPFEIFGLATAVDQVMMLTMDPEGYRKICDTVLEANLGMLDAVLEAGADFVFVGGPGREVASPLVYTEFLVPDSRKIGERVRAAGGLVYSHICSPVQPFLSMGFYNQMGLDLFETLSGPPVGNVEDLGQARRILPKDMCTRGNIGLDLLLQGSRDEVEATTISVLDSTRGSKHMVAASDYLFYDVPLENLQVVVQTVEEYS